MNWINVNEASQLDAILDASFTKPQLLFKHSTRCGISSHALYRMESGEKMLSPLIDCHYLDLLAYRPISNLIAEKWNVPHLSPQVIVLNGGKVVYTSSHSAIQPEKIVAQLA